MIPPDRLTMKDAAIMAYGAEHVQKHPRCVETIWREAKAGRLKSIKVGPSQCAKRFTTREWLEKFLLENARV